MSQKGAERRVRLNLDVWRHSATFLDVAGLGVLAQAGEESQKLVSSVPADVWRANLCAVAPAIAMAFPEKRDARNLCRAWLQRWRARDCSADGPDWVRAVPGERDSRLCVPMRPGGPVRQPFVVFAIGDECAGVMNWESRLSDGTVDDDRSLVLNIGERDNARLYSPYEMHMGDGAVATSCFVVDPDGTLMIELWRDVTSFNNCTRLGGRPISYYHGGIELSRCRESDDAASVLSYIVENGRLEGTEILTPTCYIHYCRLDFANSPVGPLYQIVDATLSLTIRMRDTLFGFDDMALMLTMALRHHPDANEGHDRSRAVFALPIGEL